MSNFSQQACDKGGKGLCQTVNNGLADAVLAVLHVVQLAANGLCDQCGGRQQLPRPVREQTGRQHATAAEQREMRPESATEGFFDIRAEHSQFTAGMHIQATTWLAVPVMLTVVVVDVTCTAATPEVSVATQTGAAE
jgi:Flp pilus assembly protein TadB